MKAIIDGFTFIITLFKTIFSMIMDFFSTIAMVFKYLISVVTICTNVLTTFPDWLKAFGLITISISIAFILIGRNTGKSD